MKLTEWLVPAATATLILSGGIAWAQNAPSAVNRNPCTQIARAQEVVTKDLQNPNGFEDLGITELGCGVVNDTNFQSGAAHAVCAMLLDAGGAFATAAALQLSQQLPAATEVVVSQTNRRLDAIRDWGLAQTAYERAYSLPCNGEHDNQVAAVDKAYDAKRRIEALAQQIYGP
jgi:hypothetical protein